MPMNMTTKVKGSYVRLPLGNLGSRNLALALVGADHIEQLNIPASFLM